MPTASRPNPTRALLPIPISTSANAGLPLMNTQRGALAEPRPRPAIVVHPPPRGPGPGWGAERRAPQRRRPLTTCVVRGLDGHLDVVRVALDQAGGGDPDELA